MKKIIFLFLFLALFLTGCGQKKDVLKNLPDLSDSEKERNLKLTEIDSEARQKDSLKVLSGNFFPVKSQDGKTIVGVRLIGEVQNTGEEVIEDVSSIVKFYDKAEKEIGVKVGEFFPGLEFLPIEAGKLGLYDLFITEPPASEKAQVLMEIKKPKEENKKIALEIVSKQVAEKEQEVVQQQNQQIPDSTSSANQPGEKIKFFSCSGSFVNNQKVSVKDMIVLVWVKNKEDNVFGYGVKKFTQDLLLPDKNKDFEINFVPFIEDKMASFEIRVFGEEY